MDSKVNLGTQQVQLNQIQDLTHRATRSEDGKGIAGDFEALLIKNVVEAMRKTVPDSGGSGRQMHDYMVGEALTQALKDGGGLGMEKLFEQRQAPQSPHNRRGENLTSFGPGPSAIGDKAPAVEAFTGTPLSEQLPPVSDDWLTSSNAEMRLQELLLGSPGNREQREESFAPMDETKRSLPLSAQMPPSSDPWMSEGDPAGTLESILKGGM